MTSTGFALPGPRQGQKTLKSSTTIIEGRRNGARLGTCYTGGASKRGVSRAFGDIAVSTGQGDGHSGSKDRADCLGRRRITADTDLRLCRYFGLTDGYWLRAQVAYDVEEARTALEADLQDIQPLDQVAIG